MLFFLGVSWAGLIVVIAWWWSMLKSRTQVYDDSDFASERGIR